MMVRLFSNNGKRCTGAMELLVGIDWDHMRNVLPPGDATDAGNEWTPYYNGYILINGASSYVRMYDEGSSALRLPV